MIDVNATYSVGGMQQRCGLWLTVLQQHQQYVNVYIIRYENREKCLAFECRLCVGRYDLKVLGPLRA